MSIHSKKVVLNLFQNVVAKNTTEKHKFAVVVNCTSCLRNGRCSVALIG